MAVITFWNNNTGKIGQTHSAIAIATTMAVEHNYKILLISTGCDDNVAMQAFGTAERSKAVKLITDNKKSMDLESGIEGMSKMAVANRLTPEMIQNYTKIVFKKRLEVVTGPRKLPDVEYEKVYGSCKDIINIAKRYYDLVFVDLNHGLENETTRNILKITDIIMFNIEQKMSELEQITELREKKKILTPLNSLILVNNYDRKSKYATKNITRELRETKEVLSVPYCNLFAETVQEGTTAEFFLNPKIRRLEDTEDRTGFFISELTRANEAIIYRIQEQQMRI